MPDAASGCRTRRPAQIQQLFQHEQILPSEMLVRALKVGQVNSPADESLRQHEHVEIPKSGAAVPVQKVAHLAFLREWAYALKGAAAGQHRALQQARKDGG